MKILHLFHHFGLAGSSIYSLRAIEACDDSKVQHLAFALWKEPDDCASLRAELESAGVSTRILNVKIPLFSAAAYWTAFQIYRQKVDLVTTDTTEWVTRLGLRAARLTKTPIVNVLHARSLPSLTEAEWRAASGKIRMVGVSNTVVADWADQISQLKLEVPEVPVIHPGLPDAFYRRRDEAARLELDARLGIKPTASGLRPPVISCVARLVEAKGIKHLVPIVEHLVERHPDVILLVAGDGPMRQELSENANAAGLEHNFRVLGNRSDVSDLLAASDVFVFPSYDESFGMAPLEAMAMGVPAVAFDIPSLREFINHGQNGFLTPLKETLPMAEAIGTLLSDPVRYAHMAQAARETAERFRIHATAPHLHRVWKGTG